MHSSLGNRNSTKSNIQTINDTISTTATINYLLTNTLYSLQMFAFLSSKNGGKSSVICSSKKAARTTNAIFRLASGLDSNEGRVEVFYNGQWGTVCAYGWDLNDANVVCRSLGLPNATSAPRWSGFGGGSGPVWLDNVNCRGDEPSLAQCIHTGWGIHSYYSYYCKYHYHDASVVCGHPQYIQYNITSLSGVITSPGYPFNLTRGHYEWTFTSSQSHAQVAIYFEHINLARYDGGHSNITLTDGEQRPILNVHNQDGVSQGYIVNRLPVKVSFFTSFSRIYSHGRRGFRLRYIIFNRNVDSAPIKRDWKVLATNHSYQSIYVSWPRMIVYRFSVLGYLITCNSVEEWHQKNVSIVADKSSTSVSCDRLVGYTRYQVRVLAYLLNTVDGSTMMYRSATLMVRTLEGVPSSSPRNLVITLVQSRDILVQWDPIPRDLAHGVLLGYRVYYYDHRYHRSKTIKTSHTQVVIRDLLPAMQYSLRVYGFTVQGSGPSQYGYITTKCGSVIENRLRGTISWPNEDYYYSWWTIDCEWTIKAKSSSGLIFVSVEWLNIPITYECTVSYFAFNNSQGQRTKYCGQRSWITLSSFGSATLQFYKRWWWWIGGSQLTLEYYIFDNGVNDFVIEPTWSIEAQSNGSTAIDVTWTSYPTNKSPSNYIAVCVSTNDPTNLTVVTTNNRERSVVVGSLKKYSEYSVQVLALFGNSSHENLTISFNETIRGSGKVLVRTDEDVPSQFPQKLSAEAKTAHSVLVKWQPIASRFVHGKLFGYRVYYKVAWSGNNYNTAFVQRDLNYLFLDGLQFFTQYRIEVAAETRIGSGPRSPAVFQRTGCTRKLSGVFGIFSSPNYPNDYPSNLNCTWIISTRDGLDVMLVFEAFQLEDNSAPNCLSNDYVSVNGKKYCGRHPRPFAIRTRQTSAAVFMYSDGGLEAAGFQATYFLMSEINPKAISLQRGEVKQNEAYVHWTLTSNDNANFVVLYKEVESITAWNVTKTNHYNVTLKDLLPYKQYEIQVIGHARGVVYSSNLLVFNTDLEPPTTSTEESSTPSPTPTGPLKLMYDHGILVGDSLIPHTWEYSERCLDVATNDDGILLLHRRFYKLYICRNGLIKFDTPWHVQWPSLFGRQPDVTVLAPYWALTDDYLSFIEERVSKVYYQVYTDLDGTARARAVLNQATKDVNIHFQQRLPTSFEASWVLVVTWKNLRHSNLNMFTRNVYNTFQAVIITDGMYTFAMYNYPDNGIQWSAPTSRENYRRFWGSEGLPVVGWRVDFKTYFNAARSGFVTIESIDDVVGKTINVSRGGGYNERSHGIKGKWFFRLETSTLADISKAETQCKRWFKNQPDPRPIMEYLEPCPCTRRQAWFDERFDLRAANWWQETDQCAVSVFLQYNSWVQECCYSNDRRSREALIVGHPGGGSAHRYSLSQLREYIENEARSYINCCIKSKLCHLYYQKRPSDDCSRYEVPEWGWMWGDPHFVTLDGKNYTFNGLGEYVMLDAKNSFFQLQARTRLAKGDGTATVFCAVVAQERNTSKVQVNLGREGNITVFVDGETIDYYSRTNESTQLNGSVVISRPKDNAFRATFPSGVSVTVTEVKGAMSILLAMPKSFRNKTKGLLGTWNGDQTDDLTTPDGDVVPADASSKDIHFQFGQKWQVNETTSLFIYQNGENVSTFSNTSFVPMFVEDLKFFNESLKQQAYAACQGDINCLFDSASTNDLTVGISTKIVGSQMVNESNILKNSPPRFHNVSKEIYLTINTTRVVSFGASDPDGDNVMFTVEGLPDDAILLRNDSSISIMWNVTSNPVELKIIAKDDKGAASILRPELYVCACHNDGVCSASTNKESNQNDNLFIIMSCQCTSGYTGRFCESDIDACQVNMNPCYPGVQCKDLSAPANVTGYECGPCPSGFTGKGDSCSDIDECEGSTHGCSQVCANTPGSFTCDCNHGYVLNINGRDCDDVNECYPASDCMQGCVNTPGSYRCTCDNYFTVDSANPKGCIPESPCKDGNHQCQQICYVSNGRDRCTCNTGYELQADNKTCLDIDECKTNNHRCNQICRNTIGWYDCQCHSGYRLDADNVTCVDIDECMEWTFNCSASMTCQNTIGSYQCQCQKGKYWIDNTCREKETTTPPPSPLATSTASPVSSTSHAPPPEPRNPSKEDIRNSVVITLLNTKTSKWDMMIDMKLKNAVAYEVTEGCASDNIQCLPKSSRARRSEDHITFTSDQVHLLPGFPKLSNPNDMIAAVAFYVKFPLGVAIQGVTDTVNQTLVVYIVNGSLARIGRAINKTVLSVAVYMVNNLSSTTIVSPTPKQTSNTSAKGLSLVIGGSVAGVVILIVIIAVIAIVLFFRKRKSKRDEHAQLEPPALEMTAPASFNNHGYSSTMELENPELEAKI